MEGWSGPSIRSLQCFWVPLDSCVIFLRKSWFEQYYSRSFVVFHSVTLQLITGEGKKRVWKSHLGLITFGNPDSFFNSGSLGSWLFSVPSFNCSIITANSDCIEFFVLLFLLSSSRIQQLIHPSYAAIFLSLFPFSSLPCFLDKILKCCFGQNWCRKQSDFPLHNHNDIRYIDMDPPHSFEFASLHFVWNMWVNIQWVRERIYHSLALWESHSIRSAKDTSTGRNYISVFAARQ